MHLTKEEIRDIHEEAIKEVEALRPPQYPCAPDLVNRTPTDFMRGQSGKRVAGKVISSDLTTGSPSPAIWGYFPMLVFLSLITLLGAGTVIGYFAIVPFHDLATQYAVKLASLSAFDAVLSLTWDISKYFVMLNAALALPVLGVLSVIYLILSEQEDSDGFARLYWTISLIIVIATIMPGTGVILAGLAMTYGAFKMFSGKSAAIAVIALSPFLGAFLAIGVGLIGLFGTRIFFAAIDRARLDSIRDASADTKADSIRRDLDAMEETRKKQAAMSLKDDSPFFPLGRSLGVLRRDGDPLTPDPEAVLGVTLADLSTHMMVSGRSGSGKTAFALKPIARLWARNDCGGILALDPGKSELPEELADVLDMVITPENTRINILSGVPPEVAAGAFFETLKTESGGIWDSSAEQDIRQALFVLDYAAGFDYVASVATYSVRSVYKFCLDKEYRESIMDALPPPTSEHLKLAYDYWVKLVPSTPAETRGSTEFTVRSWLASFVLHSKIDRWVGSESDINIAEAVATGKRIGVVASPAKYGLGGTLAINLIRQSLYNHLSERGTNWKQQEGQKAVLMIVDECAAALTTRDLDFVRIARSFGCTMLFAVQDYESLTFKFAETTSAPQEATKSFLNQFSSSIAFRSTRETIEMECARLGQRVRWMPDKNASETSRLMSSVLAEQGSGFNESSGHIWSVIQSVTGVATKVKRSLSMNPQTNNDRENEQRKEITMKGSYEVKNTIDVDEVSPYLEAPQVAIVNLNRAKAPRREICDLSMNLES